MERLLEALSHPLRLRIVVSLLRHGPQTQGALVARLSEEKGTVSKHVKVLLDAGLLGRDRPRGSCYVVRDEATLRVLRAAADLATAIASAEAEAAERGAREVGRLGLRSLGPREEAG